MTEYTKTTLQLIASNDVEEVWKKDVEYGRSWKKRGGVGAFMMSVRKSDRIEEQVKRFNWDIFEALLKDLREEGLIDDIRDLRRYLMLIEAEYMMMLENRRAASVLPLTSRATGAEQERPHGYIKEEDQRP